MLVTFWWVWAVLALVLVALEIIVPGYVFLGFAIGAAALSIVLWAGGPFGAILSGSLPLLLLAFAVLSLIAWYLLRRWLGVTKSQVKTFDEDING